MKPRFVSDFTDGEILEFLDSFDVVLADCDGVLWSHNAPIEGSLRALRELQSLGKRVYFVSNNATKTIEQYRKILRGSGFEATAEQIVIPSNVIVWYLKKVKFTGEAYVLGTTAFRSALRDAGIELAEIGPNVMREDAEMIENELRERPSIKAVIVDFDLTFNWIKLMKAARYLERRDVIFLVGSAERSIPMICSSPLLGAGHFVDIIAQSSGREPVYCSKPSQVLQSYVFERCDIPNPRRCIFIGDTITHDMKFATMCGFLKCLVGSGVTAPASVLAMRDENEETTPDYYASSLGHLLPLLEKARQMSK